MAYEKTEWKDHVVEHPNRVRIEQNPDGTATIIKDEGEVIQAGTPISAGRLNKIEDGLETVDSQLEQTNAQLAETVEKVGIVDEKTNRELISRRIRKPMISIIDDDARTAVLSNWEPILQEKNFKLDIAAITNYVGNNQYMTWDDLDRLKSQYNVDVINHTHTHPYLANISEAQIHQEMQNSTRILRDKGHTWDVMVYPYGSVDKKVRDITRQYCRTGIYIHGGVNTPPLETYELRRFNLMPLNGDMENIQHYTDQIDKAIENDGWIIFVSHAFYNSFDAEKIKAIIDYANSQEIEWVHAKEGLDKIGNLIDVGDYVDGKDYTILDADGVMHSVANSRDFVRLKPNSVNSETHLFDFPWDTMSIVIIATENATGFPENKAGTLLTYHSSGSANRSFSFQMYYLYDSNKIYTRTWERNTDSWGDFVELLTFGSNIHRVESYNKHTAESPIIDYTWGVTSFAVNTDGASGFPDNTAGIVTTYRVHGVGGWNRQEYRKYMSNEVWSRYVDSDGNWTAWQKISAV